MIRIFDKEEKIFNHLGLGSLHEATAAIVVEAINGTFELELEYPVKGTHFDKLTLRNIIFAKPNMHSGEQPFRIYDISKPISGIVPVKAEHISYDAVGITIVPSRDEDNNILPFGTEVFNEELEKDGYYLDTVLEAINNASILGSKNPFTVTRHPGKTNVFKEDGYSIPNPLHLRSILGGNEGSILEVYGGEYLFDKFEAILYDKRGEDRGLVVRYGKNMMDLEQETDSSSQFTAIFPFYSKHYTESYMSTSPVFQSAYIIEDKIPFATDWLSTTIYNQSLLTGFIPINVDSIIETYEVFVDFVNNVKEKISRYAPVIIRTPGEYENKIYVFKKATSVIDENSCSVNLIDVYGVEMVEDEITVIKDISNNPITPEIKVIYVIKDETYPDILNKQYIWNESTNKFVQYEGNGFWVEAEDGTGVEPDLPAKLPIYPISYDEVSELWVKDCETGTLYVKPRMPSAQTVTEDKYVYKDIRTYVVDIPEIETDGTVITAIKDSEGTVIEPEADVLYKISDETYPDFLGKYFSYKTDAFEEYTNDYIDILENGVLYVNETLKDLETQRVLTLDLTSEFDNIENLEPNQVTKEMIFDKAEQYLKDNDLTKVKDSITVSFIKLSDSEEYSNLKDLEVVQLGDEVTVIYEELGVSSKHRIISVEYNVLTGAYNEVEIGDKIGSLSNNVVVSGDKISGLKNDADYTDKNYVINFVAENARIFNADMLNAIIENLEAGTIRVKGHITALSGEIGGCKLEDGKLILSSEIRIENEFGTQFSVDENGNVTANSVKITGSSEDGASVEMYDGKLRTEKAQIGAEFVETPIVTTELLSIKGIANMAIVEEEDSYQYQTPKPSTSISNVRHAAYNAYELWVYVTINDVNELWQDHNITVNYNYSRSDNPSVVISRTRIFTLFSDTSRYGTGVLDHKFNEAEDRYEFYTGDYVLDGSGWNFINISIVSTAPSSLVGWTESKSIDGLTALGLDSNLYPTADDTFDIGSPSSKWRRIYAVRVNMYPPTIEVTSNYQLELDDDGVVILAGHATNAVKITIPIDSVVDFPINTEIAVVKHQAGTLTIGTASGATLKGKSSTTTFEITDSVGIKKIEANTWIMAGSYEEVV